MCVQREFEKHDLDHPKCWRSQASYLPRASDFFQDWWAEMTHGAKNGGSFSEMMGPSLSNKPQLTFGYYTLPTH